MVFPASSTFPSQSTHPGGSDPAPVEPSAPAPSLFNDMEPVGPGKPVGVWTARVRTSTLTLSDPVEFTSLTLVERYGEPDTLVIDGDVPDLGPAKTSGTGIVVWDDQGSWRFSGQMSPLTRGQRVGMAAYTADTGLLWRRNAWPSPTTAWTAPSQTRDVLTGTVEARILALIDRNAGPTCYHAGVYANRRIPALRFPTSQGRGASATTTVRLGEVNLGALVARLAESADLRVTIRQTYDPAPHLDIVVTTVPDLSGWARFGDAATGNLGLLGDGWSYMIGAPPATIILPVAGDPEVSGDTYIGGVWQSTSRETGWGGPLVYAEKFLDLTGTTDTTEIAERVAETVAETAPLVEVQAPIVAGELGFGDGAGQIPVGSKVAVTLDGVTVVERIRQVTTTVQASEGAPTVTVEPVFGSPDAGVPVEQKRLRGALRRLAAVEGGVAGIAAGGGAGGTDGGSL